MGQYPSFVRAKFDKLFLTNIQGEGDFTNSALKYYNDSGVVTTANDGTDVNITSKSFSSDFNSGNYIKVNHFNHGMYSSTNKVKLYNVEPNTLPTTITVNMTDTTTSTVGVADTTLFAKFEGIAVSTNDPGYAIIENEIIKYTDVTTDSITVAERGLEETIALPHDSGTSIRKYELSGISLRRINDVNLSLHSDIQDDEYYGQVYNVGSGINYSVNEIAAMISDNTTNIPARPGECRVTLANCDKIYDAFGWKPQIKLDEWING